MPSHRPIDTIYRTLSSLYKAPVSVKQSPKSRFTAAATKREETSVASAAQQFFKKVRAQPNQARSCHFLDWKTAFWLEGSLYLGPSAESHTEVLICEDVTEEESVGDVCALTLVRPLAIRAISVGWYTQLRT